MRDLNSLVTSKLAFGVLIGSLVATGGTAMAAFAGVLPDPLQQSAHVVLGAPEPGDAPVDDDLDDDLDDETDADGDAIDDDGAKGPDVTGSAAFGLCTAYTNGGLSENSTAYKAFDDVEGGIDAYCDTVIAGKADKPGKAEKADKPEKANDPKSSEDEGAEDESGDQPADAPADEPADGSGDAPVEDPTETAPDQPKSAPDAEKPAKELPAQSNGNGGKDR